MPTERRTPAQVWREMQRGNARFVAGDPQHPRQDVDRRAQLAEGSPGASGPAVGAGHPTEPDTAGPHMADPRVARPRAPDIDAYEVGREHLRDAVGALLASSELISDEVAAGTLAIVGANYRLREGKVVPDVVVGQL